MRTKAEVNRFLDYLSYLAHDLKLGKTTVSDEEREALALLNGVIAKTSEFRIKSTG